MPSCACWRMYVAIAVVCTAEELVLGLGLPAALAGKLLRIVPVAALNSCVLGTVLVERTQSFYADAEPGSFAAAWATCWLCCWSQRPGSTACAARLSSAFRGLPITLVYIGAGAGHLWLYRPFAIL